MVSESENARLASTHFASGLGKRKAGRLTEAFADLSRAAALAPQDPDCLRQAAEVAYLVGQPQVALAYCARLRSIAPELDVLDLLEAQIQIGRASCRERVL